ncbi:FtsX-like permease family protein [Desulfovibrionales bacterium]
MGIFFRLFFQGVRDLFRTPWSLCMTLAAITLVSFLGGAFLLLVHNINLQVESRQGNVEFQVFWSQGASPEEVAKVWAGLSGWEHVRNVRTFTSDQALQVLGESFQGAVDLEGMKGRSPLPLTALLECQMPSEDQKKWAAAMVERLKSLPQVERVAFNPLHIDLLSSWVGMVRLIFWPVVGFLLMVVALVVGNTIKLALLIRQEELEILRFVGASRAYIQFPLLVGGAFQGFLGSSIALVGLKFGQQSLERLFHVPPLWISFSFFPYSSALAMVGVLTLTGIFSSMVALRN